jgi:hypothetical protein
VFKFAQDREGGAKEVSQIRVILKKILHAMRPSGKVVTASDLGGPISIARMLLFRSV